MSSRRKQSKPVGFLIEGTNSATTNPEAEDDASSRSSHTSSHTSSARSYSSSSNSDNANSNTNSNKEDTVSSTNVQSSTQKATGDKNLTNDSPVEEALPNIDPTSEDSPEADSKNVGGEDLKAPSTNPVVNALIEGNREDSLEPGEVEASAKMKRKREDESELNLSQNQNEEPSNVFECSENMGDYTENLDYDDHPEDEELDEDEVDGFYDENSMNGDFSLNDEYSDNPVQNYYAHGNKRVMINKQSSVSGQYPVLYNAMHTDAGEYGMHMKASDSMRVNAINSAYDGEDSGLLSFKCKVCGKGFKHRRSLNRHVKLHSGEKNFHCPYCATAFARSDHLKAHIRTHNNSKPFRCSICQCGYSTQAALKVHIAHHHSKSKFKCVLCNDLEFHSQLALEGHIYKNHSKENGHEMNTMPENGSTKSIHNQHSPNHRPPVIQNNKYSHPYSEMYENNSQFHSSYSRVHMADINNYHHENKSPEYLGDETTGNNISYNGIAQEDQDMESGQAFVNNVDFDDDIHRNNDSDNQEKHHHSDNDGSQLSIVFESPTGKQHSENSDPSMKAVRTETATFIDTYGEDDDEQHNKSNNTDSSIGNISQTEETIPITSAMKNGDTIPEEDDDDVIIEDSASATTNTEIVADKKLEMNPTLKMALKTSQAVPNQTKLNPPPLLPAPNMSAGSRNGLNSSSMARSNGPMISNDNYCDMCNARFSNSESFAAHMRVVHPNIPNKMIYQNGDYHPHSQHAGKMPYLSNLLNKGGEPKKAYLNPNQITPVINKSDSQKEHLLQGKSTCSIPNCNCSPSGGITSINGNHGQTHHQSFFDAHQTSDIDLYSAKETHYTCGQCSLTLLKLADFIAHIKQEHCVEVFRCILCKQMQLFDNLSLLREHFFQVHQSIRTEYYRCRHCPLNSSSLGSTLFLSAEELSIHIDQVHQHPTPANSNLTPTHSSRNINMRMAPPLPAALSGSIYPGGQPGQFTGQNRAQPYPYGRQQQPPIGHYSTKCFKCPYCDSDFSQQNYLNQHIHIAHNSKQVTEGDEYPTLKQTLQQSGEKSQVATGNNAAPTFPCQYCRNTFTNRQQLERHVRIHISSIDRKCNICDKHFASHEALSQHKLTHCKTFNSIAPDASNNTNSTSDVNSSLQDSTPTGIAVCVYCKKNIEDETQFKEHFKLHNNIGQSNVSGKTNSFICICCRQTLTSNNEYMIHMKHHLKRSGQQQPTTVASNELPEANESAENNKTDAPTTNDKADQTVAKASSTSSKLKCSKCEVKFEEWRELADHIAKDHPSTKNSDSTKTSEPVAPETNTPKSGTEKTTSTPIHPVIKAEKIDNPEKTAVVAPATTQPITNGHSAVSNPASNNSSPRSLNSTNTNNNNAQSLVTNNSELCEICSSKFDSNQKLQAHLLIKHEFGNTNASVYTCPVCDESYSQPESLLAHANIHGLAARIYKCSQCSLAFVFKSQLINHSFSHRNQAPQAQRPKLNNNHQTMYQKMPPHHRHSLPHQSHNGIHPMQQVHHGFNQSPINGNRHPPPPAHLLQHKTAHPQRHMASHIGGAPMVGPYGHMDHMNPHQHDKMRQQIHMNSGLPGFRCDECNAIFDSFRMFQTHKQSFHGRTMLLNRHVDGSNGGINRMNDIYNKTNVF